MAEGTPKYEEDAAESPVLSYSMALREGKRIVTQLAELMATPIADIEQPSLVDFTLSSSVSSTPGGAGDVARRQLFQSPAGQNGGEGAVCLLDTTNTERSPSGPIASLATAMDNLHIGDPNGKSDDDPEHRSMAEPAPTFELEEAGDDNSNKCINGGGLLFDDHELSLLESRRDGAALTALNFTSTPLEGSPVLLRDSMPLIYFTPDGPKKPTHGFLAKSDSEADVLDRVADEQLMVPSYRHLGINGTETMAPVDEVTATATLLVPLDKALNRSLSFIVAPAVAPAVDHAEVDEAATSAPVPSDTTVDMRLSFVVTPATEPVEADKAAATASPNLPAGCDTGESHTHSSLTAEDSFVTAYDSPMHPSWRSFVVSRDQPGLLGDNPAAGDRDHTFSASGAASAASEDLPASEATFARPAPPTKPGARPRTKASAAANSTVVVAPRKPVVKPVGSSLATRKSLLPPPTATRRPERPSAPVKAKVPLGRPGCAPKAADATFALDPAAPMAPPSGVLKVAHRQQTKKQEPPSVRPKVPAPRGPGSAAATVAASPAARQSMPAPGVASGAVRRAVSARRSVVVATSAVPPAPSTATRPPLRPLAPSNSAASGSKMSRPSAPTGLGEASKGRVALPKLPLANGKLNPEPRVESQPTKAQLPRSRIAAPRARVAGGFSRLPPMAGSSAATRAAPLAPVRETPSTRLSSTPVRGNLPSLDNAVGPQLTPIRRQ
ncbi:uncharacterized protein LOC144159951 [Haemaphysalis longicornis]